MLTCPLCCISISEKDIQLHYEEELGRIDHMKRKRAAAVAASSQFKSHLDSLEKQVFSFKQPSVEKKEKTQCFMCGMMLDMDPELVNAHIDQCLTTQSNNDWTEYTWGGETRVRATALVEAPLVSYQTKTDEDEEVNIDEDEDFGPSQFNEQDLIPFQETETLCEEPIEPTDLVLESLKQKLIELESRASLKCLICLEGYKEPVVSIVCWHVHCEKCWLQTLSSRRLCPQCQKITSPSELRRIYL